MNLKGKKVFVGLSGGVDSSVSAALLKDAGALVTGVFIKGWYPPGMPCSWSADRRDAMRVAAKLHIPFVTLEAEKEYKEGVIDYLLREYAAGRTPNPDVMCNREVKFGAFYSFAKEQGADFIATGHYARMKHGELHQGVDKTKDQSYFLWAVPKQVLQETLFPVGGMHKEEVRKFAQKYNLPVANKTDSQGICFLGSISVEEFLTRELGSHEGDAVDEEGAHVGKHTGAVLHTIGERIALLNASPGPWYVVRKNLKDNVLIVTKTQNKNLASVIELEEANWLADIEGVLEGQYRYHGPRITGTLSNNVFTPSESVESLASGQSLVLYKGTHLIGGGIMH